MKPDKNFKLNKQVKRLLASSRITKEQGSVFKHAMISAQLHSEVAKTKTWSKQDNTDS